MEEMMFKGLVAASQRYGTQCLKHMTLIEDDGFDMTPVSKCGLGVAIVLLLFLVIIF